MIRVEAQSLHRGYWVALAGFLVSVALLFFTVVEMRRAILFPLSDYVKIGSPSAILYFDLRHLPLLLIGSIGAWLSYRYMARLEAGLREKGIELTRLRNLLAMPLMLLLIADMLTYRGVPASRIASAGKISVGQAFPLDSFPGWLRPVGEAINYVALVWHATVLGILIGALFLVLAAGFLKPVLGGKGFKSHLAGALLAIPYPFCSCCAAPVGATLFRGGASLGPTLAFVVSSPMLNITTLILATALLPPEFALLRIAGGLIVAVLVTYLVSVVASRWAGAQPVTELVYIAAADPSEERRNRFVELSSKVVNAYSRLFRFERLLQDKVTDSPAAFISAWLAMAWGLARVVVPVLFVGAAVAAAIVDVLPSATNNPLGVIVAAAFGTLLMIPTWTEIAIAGPLIRDGLTGPAAALLLTLPAVSIPCLAIIGGALSKQKVAILLGFAVFVVGILAGLAFL